MLLAKFKVVGHSMEPNINNGENVLVSGFYYLFQKPEINDIVAIKSGNKVLIKRIVKIKNLTYFVKGDNKKDSFDSRKFGFIQKDNILGKVIYKF